MTDYNYSISGDLSNGLDPRCLHNTIENYGFSNSFKGLLMEDDDLTIMFTGSLSVDDQDDLDTIISQHDPDDSQICEETLDIGYAVGISGDAESSDLSSTNSTSPQLKLRLDITDLIEGRYRIGWYYEWSHSMTSYDFRARIQLNDTTDLMEHSQEVFEKGTEQSIPTCGFAHVDISEGDYYIDLDYWTEIKGTAYIKNARLEIWRVN